ncbi:MAG TPA: TonB-dependent receptor [Longimicrobiales bacterium]
MQAGLARRVLIALGALVFSAAMPATAQQPSAWLSGRVVESGSGDPVAGASVAVVGEPSLVALTNDEGAWRLGPLGAGEVLLRVEHLAYARAELRIVPAERTRVQVSLTPRPLDLDALVVTAGRRPQALAETPVPTELVSRAEIQRSGATDLAAVLTERTGVELQGGHPAGSGVMLQGMGSERVLVLLDGQPFVGRVAGVTDISRVPTSIIERVEVVKGPQSTLYGSEAMGGVVNIVTRQPSDIAFTGGGSLIGGAQGRLDLSGHGMAALRGFSLLGDLGHRTIELAPGQGSVSGALANRWDALAKLRWTSPSDALAIETSLFGVDERQRWRSGPLYQFADNRQWSGRVGATWNAGRHRVVPTLYATGFDHLSRRATTEDPVAGSGEQENHRLYEGELLYGVDFGGVVLDAGVESRFERVESPRLATGEEDRTTLETFVQTTIELGDVTLVPGVRGSWSGPWGTHVTPRLAALWRPVESLALRASAGEGFRAPDFKELHMEFLNIGPGFGYVVRGNPDLEPEVSRNVTASVEWNAQRFYTRMQGFHNRFERFIETQAVGDSAGVTVYTYGNIDDGSTSGVELESGVNRGPWRLELGGTLLRAVRAENDEPLLGRPSRSARATLGWAHPVGLRMSTTGLYTGRTPMTRDENGTQYRDAWMRFDARVAQRLAGGVELVLGVDNMFDTTVDLWPGFTGRHIYAGVSWNGSADFTE